MSDLPAELDLKFLPEWLKETPAPNRYADFEGERERPRGDRDGRRPGGPGGPRSRPPGGGGGGRPPGGGGGRPPFGKKPFGQGQKPGGPRRDGPDNRNSRDDRGQDRGAQRPPQEPQKPVVRVEISPEPGIAQSIAKQIKSSSRACSVFGIAKMFLERPERHRVRIIALDSAAVLHQAGDGPISFDLASVERAAFRALKDQFYVEETVQGDPPKGNFTNVARDRASGTLLGPTSHHGYQLALRKLYEERYSRRMDFQDLVRQIEVISDPAAVDQWKVQASSSTVFKTKTPEVAEGVEAPEPIVFKDVTEAEQHFKQHHLPALLKSGNSLETSGTNARVQLDRAISFAVRDAADAEQAFPAQMVNSLRPFLGEAGLHYFKWNKKILYVCAIRPQRHPENADFSVGFTSILKLVAEQPGINRPELAAALLGGLPPEAPETTEKKTALASDLHYLIQVGHVIEFQNGALDLPPSPKGPAPAPSQSAKEPTPEAKSAIETTPETTPPPVEETQTEESTTAPAAPTSAQDEGYQLLPLLSSVGC